MISQHPALKNCIKKCHISSSGDFHQMTYNSREEASNKMTEEFHWGGKGKCSDPAESQYLVRRPTKPFTMFAFLPHLLEYVDALCAPVQRREYSEMLNRNSDTVYVRVEVGETHARQCESSTPLTRSLLAHSPSIPPCLPHWLSAAPVHLRTGWPGAENAGRLRHQAEEAGL